jgi:hypothetical protein
MRSLIHRIFIVTALTLGAAGLGCDKGKRLDGEPPPETSKAGGGATFGSTPPVALRVGAGDYIKDATSVPGKLKEKVGGPVRLLELTLYPGYVLAQIQDPKKHENVDAYELRDGQVGDPEPVKFMGTTPTAKDLDDAAVDVASVDFGAVPRMTKDALVQLKIDDGKVTHLILKRGRPFHDQVRWRVYVSGTRKDGSVEYDPTGSLKKVWN